MNIECLFLDVFTNVPYAGNQLAVFPDADGLNAAQMQALANEINYSETIFILKTKNIEADLKARIFTPRSELPFAGHPVLGAAYAMCKVINIATKTKGILKLETGVGVIPLDARQEVIWIEQNKPQFFKQHAGKKEIAVLAGLKPEDISDALPVEEVSTGNKVLIVPVKTLSGVQKAVSDAGKLEIFSKQTGCLAPYIFTMETVDKAAKIHSRFFAPHMGILEDPATGSAAGPLTAYLLKHKIFGSEFELINEQGIEMGRPSKIMMRGKLAGGVYSIYVGGNCSFAGKGIFTV